MTDRELLEFILTKVINIEQQLTESKAEQERYKQKSIRIRQRAKLQMEAQMNHMPPAIRQIMQAAIPTNIDDEDEGEN